ncbi:MAG: hypothetical protein MZU95_01925 [Desulfomicrobium escambiense]|nr:hypothetical protein [Desulfomicrobium escambiense]
MPTGPSSRRPGSPSISSTPRTRRYGKLTVVRNEEQVTPVRQRPGRLQPPDVGAAEECRPLRAAPAGRHPQGPAHRRGTASGRVAEVLKYPGVRVDCVELDPAVIRLARRHLPGPARAALDDPRVRIFTRDGRAFLGAIARTAMTPILLDLPDPATTQVNRLLHAGVLRSRSARSSHPAACSASSSRRAENYISQAPSPAPERRSSGTLRDVFPGEVRVVPGAERRRPGLGRSAHRRSRIACRTRIARLGLETTVRQPGDAALAASNPARVDRLSAALTVAGTGAKINRDLVPVSYYFQSLLWASQFGGPGSRLLQAAGAGLVVLDPRRSPGRRGPRAHGPGLAPQALARPGSSSR